MKLKIAYKGMPAFLNGLHMGRFTRDIYSGEIPHHHDFQYNDGSFPSFGEVIPKYVIDAMSADKCVQSDSINPNHYKSHPSKVECIQITEHMNFCRGNAIKYIWRAGEKGNEIEDLEKAKWYIEREIQRLRTP